MLDGYDTSLSDLLITDVTEKLLYEKIAQKLGVVYLADTKNLYSEEVSGILFGRNERLMISLILDIKQKRKDVIFLLDTASPFTYISRNVLDRMGYEAHGQNIVGKINGREHTLQISPKLQNNTGSNLHDLNILGMAFLRQCEAKITVDCGLGVFKLIFK